MANLSTDLLDENAQRYFNAVKNYFRFVKKASVLEIGPFYGWHTKIIESFEPASQTLVEYNTDAVNHLKQNFKHEIVHADANVFLKEPRHFDVVVCCGVLYHLHSPIHMLELIANMATPKFVIIETVNTPNLVWGEEIDNTPGMRYVDNNWLSARCHITPTFNMISSAMKNLGYQLYESSVQQHPNVVSKEDVCIGVFVK